MSRIRAVSRMRAFQSTPTKPRGGAFPDSCGWVIRPAFCSRSAKSATRTSPLRSTCAGTEHSFAGAGCGCYAPLDAPRISRSDDVLSSASMPRELLTAYPPATSRYDEMLEAPLTPRAHWRHIVDELTATPPEMMRERLKAVQRQVREDGVTY